MFDYSGKTVIVSGGTSGINLGIAESYAKAGANVFVFSRSAEKVADAVSLLQMCAIMMPLPGPLPNVCSDLESWMSWFQVPRATFRA